MLNSPWYQKKCPKHAAKFYIPFNALIVNIGSYNYASSWMVFVSNAQGIQRAMQIQFATRRNVEILGLLQQSRP